ncbi:MAG: hypothetical protein IJ306_08140 [Oscillospiraceae bacterium]|nr:hypothetical protein [Oscillospiraceae bacterium]
MKTNWKDIADRAIKAFVEGFLGSIAVNLGTLVTVVEDDAAFKTVAVSIGVGAVAAGVSAAWNLVFGPLFAIDRE